MGLAPCRPPVYDVSRGSLGDGSSLGAAQDLDVEGPFRVPNLAAQALARNGLPVV